MVEKHKQGTNAREGSELRLGGESSALLTFF
jgi:hypothetical protein